MNSPLLAIRIKYSEVEALVAGHQFDTIAEFDATVTAARRAAQEGRVAFVVAWKDRASFHGCYDLQHPETLVEHIARVCRCVLLEPRLAVLLPGVRFTLRRLCDATLAERVSGLTCPCAARHEARWNSAA